MFDARATRELLDALRSGADESALGSLLSSSDLDLIFPAVGLTAAVGIGYLRGVLDPVARARLDPEGGQVVDYFLSLLGRRDAFETLLVELEARGPELVRAAFEQTCRFLPDGCELGTVRYVLLPLGYDYRTDRETVYMDPAVSLEYGLAGIQHSLAHELHHVARYRLTREELTLMRPDAVPPPQDLPGVFREWGSWLEAEGIADCVANATQFEVPQFRGAAEERRRQMTEYQTILEVALEPFRPEATAPDAPGLVDLRQRLRSLAHPIGYRMAEAIESEYGSAALRTCVGQPRTFLTLFNEVARSRSLVEFPPSLIEQMPES
jgi:putative zinc-dependent peptidase DUF5700